MADELGYLFTVSFNVDGPHCCRFYDVSRMLGHNPDSFKDAERKRVDVAARVGVKTQSHEHLPQALYTLFLRGKLGAAEGPFLLKTDTPMEVEAMNELLVAKQREGKLREFLEEARI